MKHVPMPPIGIVPAFIWAKRKHEFAPRVRDHVRAQGLFNAVFRYRAAGFEPPPEWDAELREILVRSLIVNEL